MWAHCSIMNYKCAFLSSFIFLKFRFTVHALFQTPCSGECFFCSTTLEAVKITPGHPRSSALTFWTLNYSIFKQWKGRKIYKLTERTLKMTTAQFVEKSVTVNNNSPIQDYVHPYDQTQPTLVQYVGENRCPNRFKVCLQQRPSKVRWNYTWNLTLRGWFAPPSINRYRGALSKIENHILWHLIERALPSN